MSEALGNALASSPMRPEIGQQAARKLHVLRTGTALATPEGGTMEHFRCNGCGDVIGVYEPLVLACGESDTRTTSRAAEPDLKAGESAHYHRNCYPSAAQGRPRALPAR